MTDSIEINTLDQLRGNWNYPTSIHFGNGRIQELADACQQLSSKRPLLVTDSGLVQLPFVSQIIKSIEAAGLVINVFSQVKPNPTGTNIDDGVKAFQQGKHDGVIALGGGSALDAGKAIALMVGQDQPLWDFEDVGDNWLRVRPEGMAPTIAIPTTAGTGSEVGRASVIVDEASHSKKIIFHPDMLPKRVIADPQLTVGLPPNITAATGLDALVHNLEAYCAPGYHPMADGIALEGMRLIKNHLPMAFTNGEDLVARSHMLVASSMGATAFQKGLGAVHALAHPLGALFDAHHGLLNAILLPYILVYNRPAIEGRLAHVARCLELSDDSFSGLFDWLLGFRKQLAIPHSLQEIGINDDRADEIGQLALQDPSAAGNPIPLTAQQYSEIFIKAVRGELHEDRTA
ncbi:MAG: iron-containing alcohol dehydrogenase [Gammaproteobacteria bacterium]|nr:iron-containing alcohol dehydrogenase [Gammaproteobacteria bacterium]